MTEQKQNNLILRRNPHIPSIMNTRIISLHLPNLNHNPPTPILILIFLTLLLTIITSDPLIKKRLLLVRFGRTLMVELGIIALLTWKTQSQNVKPQIERIKR